MGKDELTVTAQQLFGYEGDLFHRPTVKVEAEYHFRCDCQVRAQNQRCLEKRVGKDPDGVRFMVIGDVQVRPHHIQPTGSRNGPSLKDKGMPNIRRCGRQCPVFPFSSQWSNQDAFGNWPPSASVIREIRSASGAVCSQSQHESSRAGRLKLGDGKTAIMQQNLVFLQQPGGFEYRSLLQALLALSRIMATHNPANQGHTLVTYLTYIGDESKADAGHCFAGQLPIEFARPTLQPWPPIGGRIDGHRAVTTVFMALPFFCLRHLLSKTLD